MYSIVFASSARRSLKRLSKDAQTTCKLELEKIAIDPYQGERLHGSLSFLFSFHFRYKGVAYRIAYSFEKENKMIKIHLVGSRENFYARLRRLILLFF